MLLFDDDYRLSHNQAHGANLAKGGTLLAGLLLGVAVLMMFGGLYQVVTYRQRKLDTVILNDGSDRSFIHKRETKSLFDGFAGAVKGFAPVFLNGSRKEKLEKKLDQAGMSETPEDVVASQIAGGIIGVAFGCIGFLAGGIGILTVLFFGFMGVMRPQMTLTKKWNQRRKDIDEAILSFVDVFSLMLETGASIYSGLEKAGNAVGGALGEEMNVMLRRSRSRGMTEALHQMSEKMNHPDLTGLVTILHQANKYGAGMDVVYSLRQFSFAVRTNKRNQIDQKVQKMSTKILFPMFFFILMPMMAILFAPVMLSFGRSGLL
jgi:tight adherence protein C